MDLAMRNYVNLILKLLLLPFRFLWLLLVWLWRRCAAMLASA